MDCLLQEKGILITHDVDPKQTGKIDRMFDAPIHLHDNHSTSMEVSWDISHHRAHRWLEKQCASLKNLVWLWVTHDSSALWMASSSSSVTAMKELALLLSRMVPSGAKRAICTGNLHSQMHT